MSPMRMKLGNEWLREQKVSDNDSKMGYCGDVGGAGGWECKELGVQGVGCRELGMQGVGGAGVGGAGSWGCSVSIINF